MQPRNKFSAVLLHIKDLPEEVISVQWQPAYAETSAGRRQPRLNRDFTGAQQGSDSLTLWAGLRTRGLLEVRTDASLSSYRVTHYDTTDGLPPGAIQCFLYNHHVVFGTQSGLYIQAPNPSLTPPKGGEN